MDAKHVTGTEADQLIRVDEVARLLAVSPRFVWQLRSAGRLPVLKLGRATRFRTSDVQRLVREGVR